MKKNCKRTVLAVLLILLVSSFCITAYATDNKETIDYEALFAREDEVDGYLAESYYIEVSNVFDKAPADFVEALSEEQYSKINSLAYALAVEHNSDFSSYENILSDLLSSEVEGSKKSETILMMKLGILRFKAGRNVAPEAFERDNHEQVRNFYNNYTQLFLQSIAEMGSYAIEEFTDALVFELNHKELEALDIQLSDDASADWITDDISATITVIRDRIYNILKPTPPVTKPNPTEPTSPATEATQPTEPAPITPQEEPNDHTLIVTVIVSVALISCIVAYLFYKKRSK